MNHVSYNYIIIILSFLTLLTSCRKSITDSKNPAAVQLYNAMSDGTAVYMNLSDQRPKAFRSSRLVNNNTYATTNSVLYLNQSPQSYQLYNRFDTLPKDNPILEGTLEYEMGSIYSLFIYGTVVNPKVLYFKERLPTVVPTDSITNIRIANFSNVHDISINLKGQAQGSFIARVNQVSLSSFISLPANSSVTRYEFEVRDHETGDQLTSFIADNINSYKGYNNTSFWLSTSSTLTFVGRKGGAGTEAPKVVRMLHR